MSTSRRGRASRTGAARPSPRAGGEPRAAVRGRLRPAEGAPADTSGDPPIRDFSQSLPMLLLRCHQAVMAQFRPVLRAHRITEQQWRVLRALASVDEARITRLAEMTLISKPSLSRLLPALQARRLIVSAPSLDDARGTSVRIAPAGSALIRTVGPHSEARYREIARAIGETEMGGLYEVLSKVAARLEGESFG